MKKILKYLEQMFKKVLYKEQMFCYYIYEQSFQICKVIEMKKYKIKNRFRFITFVTVMMLIVSFAVSGLFNTIKAQSVKEQEYVEISVEAGDTLWQLAKTYGSGNCDVRELVYNICQVNHIKAEDLRAGQTILIPID